MQTRVILEALMVAVTRAALREVYASEATVIVRTMPSAELTFCCFVDLPHEGERRKMNTWMFDLARENYPEPAPLLQAMQQRAAECVDALMAHV